MSKLYRIYNNIGDIRRKYGVSLEKAIERYNEFCEDVLKLKTKQAYNDDIAGISFEGALCLSFVFQCPEWEFLRIKQSEEEKKANILIKKFINKFYNF